MSDYKCQQTDRYTDILFRMVLKQNQRRLWSAFVIRMNIHQISRIDLSPDVVDGIVFWTKNPIPMIERVSELEKYVYYFQFILKRIWERY